MKLFCEKFYDSYGSTIEEDENLEVKESNPKIKMAIMQRKYEKEMLQSTIAMIEKEREFIKYI